MRLSTGSSLSRLAATCLLALPVCSGGVLAGRAMAAALVAQDLDGDGDVDSVDLTLFMSCLSGPEVPYSNAPTCRFADVDQDGDVDMADFGILQRCYSAAGIAADPACGGCALPKDDLLVTALSGTVIVGLSAEIQVADSQIGASYQLRNNADNSNVGSPVLGSGDTIMLPTNVLTANAAFNVLATNARWGCSAPLTTTVSITVVPDTRNKIGAHVVCGSRNYYAPWLQICADAGRPVPVIKCMEEFGAADDPTTYSPSTLIIGRLDSLDGYNLQGMNEYINLSDTEFLSWTAEFYNTVLKPFWDDHYKVDAWEIFNEWDAHYDWQAKFLKRMMDLAEAGTPPHRIVLFGCAKGTPKESEFPYIADACLRAKAHGNHILALHEYATDPELMEDSYAKAPEVYILRYRRLYRYLATQNAVIPLVISEAGQGVGASFVGTPLFVQDFGWYNDKLREDPYVIGCCAWTLGNCGWGPVNFQDALPSLTQYIISH